MMRLLLTTMLLGLVAMRYTDVRLAAKAVERERKDYEEDLNILRRSIL